MNKIFFSRVVTLSFVTCHLALFSCGNRNPNLSEKQLQALMNDETQKAETPLSVLPDSTYVPPAGVKYTEIRSIEPDAPPEIIDIAGNLENKKEFKLSDIAESVRYIHLQQPPNTKFTSISNIVSDDEHIFVNTLEGLFCYSTEGQYLYTLAINELERGIFGAGTGGVRIVSGVLNNIDLLNGRLIYRTYHWPSLDEGVTDLMLNVFDVKELDAQMLFNTQSRELKQNFAQPKYQRRINLYPTKDTGASSRYLLMDDQSLFISNSLTGVAIYGDTLCKFNDYDRPAIAPEMNRVFVPSYIYRINEQVTLRKGFNDTVFRVAPPNRLIPAYVMNWGEYKPDINQHASGSDLDGKLVFGEWIETPQFIFIEYTEGRNYTRRRDQGKVKFYWAIYDKTAKTLTHFLTSTTPAMRDVDAGTMTVRVPMPTLIENDIEPVGMPFYPEGLNHKGEMYMIFSKERVADYIASGRYRNDKLHAISDNMPDDGFCIMIVK